MTSEPLDGPSSVKRFLVQVVVDLEVAAGDERAAATAASTAIRLTNLNGARRVDHSIRTVEEYRCVRLPSDAIAGRSAVE